MTAMEKTYENAIAILRHRRRGLRPISPSQLNYPTNSLPNGPPAFKGVPSVAGMNDWLQRLGYSDRHIKSLNIIHVAGTKGKGGTCANIESLLRTHGKRAGFPRKTGLYTSPHLICEEERIRINFRPLSRDLFTKYFFEIYNGLSLGENKEGPRYLQLLALLSYHTFLNEGVDVAIYETHHGGEFDATNFIRHPVITAITTIGEDHIKQLGPSIENIAWHKAGIFKPGTRAFSAMQEQSVTEVLNTRAEEKSVTLEFVQSGIDPLEWGIDSWATTSQQMNGSLAVAVTSAFLEQTSLDETERTLSEDDVRHGLQNVQWPGRFQSFQEGDITWFLDCAHNELSMEQAARWYLDICGVTQEYYRPFPNKDTILTLQRPASTKRILIFGQESDQRDSEAVLRALAGALASEIHHVIFTTHRQHTNDLQSAINGLHVYRKLWQKAAPDSTVLCIPNISQALDLAREAGRGACLHVLLTGSVRLVGAALCYFKMEERVLNPGENQNVTKHDSFGLS